MLLLLRTVHRVCWPVAVIAGAIVDENHTRLQAMMLRSVAVIAFAVAATYCT